MTSRSERTSSPLYVEIARQDAAMTRAFNSHDVASLMSLFSEDLEFYHDTGGLQRFTEVEAGFRSLLSRNDGMRRELVEGSLRVFPIKDYGALQLGAHRFCHVEDGQNDCGTFEFVHIWKEVGGHWKIARVISYGH